MKGAAIVDQVFTVVLSLVDLSIKDSLRFRQLCNYRNIPEIALERDALRPFVLVRLVGSINSSAGEGTASRQRKVVAN